MPEQLQLPPRSNTAILQPVDFENASLALGCDAASIRAVVGVESPRGAFDEDGHPSLLFERHKFHLFTGGRFDMVAPDLSRATPGGYGKYSEQYGRLCRAYLLAADEALRSASWGMFQILGENYRDAGYGTVEAFALAMCDSEAEQLAAFVRFIGANRLMRRALVSRDWSQFARLYNGPAYSINRYDEKLRAEYQEALR